MTASSCCTHAPSFPAYTVSPGYTVSPPPSTSSSSSESSTPTRSRTASRSPSSNSAQQDDGYDDDDAVANYDDGSSYGGSSGSTAGGGSSRLRRCYPSTAGKCITTWDVCVKPLTGSSNACPAGTNPFFCPSCVAGTQGPCRNTAGVCSDYADQVYNRCARDSIECYKDTQSLPAPNVCPPCIMGTAGPCQNPFSRVCYGTAPGITKVIVVNLTLQVVSSD